MAELESILIAAKDTKIHPNFKFYIYKNFNGVHENWRKPQAPLACVWLYP